MNTRTPLSEDYSRQTRRWLNQRFDLMDADGVYVPNQSSYGFSALAFRLEEYLRCYRILALLNRMKYNSFLDAGSADGFMAGLVSRIFRKSSICSDLSDRALLRARQMYGLPGATADLHWLPFCDNSIDVVLASEVLEHVIDPASVLKELTRVARSAVIITTPRAHSESEVKIQQESLDPNEPHAHIHFFTDMEMRKISPGNFQIQMSGIRNRWLVALLNRIAWGDSDSFQQRKAYFEFTVTSAHLNETSKISARKMLLTRYEKTSSWKKAISSPGLIGKLLRLDAFLCRATPDSALDHMAVYIKDPACLLNQQQIPCEILAKTLLTGFTVPPLVLK